MNHKVTKSAEIRRGLLRGKSKVKILCECSVFSVTLWLLPMEREYLIMAQQAVADVGLIGLAVMGETLALNMADHGYKVAVYNRTTEVMKKFIAREHPP